MRTFHISFFKTILSSDGHPFKCLQGSLEVQENSADKAIESAKRAFRQEGRSWSDRADMIEVNEQRGNVLMEA